MAKRIGGGRRTFKLRRASLRNPLARPLDTSQLAGVVPYLPPETLHQLIRHRGLDACGEIVASATPAQLTSVLDLDLWHSARPGRDEHFDAERFGEWLELLAGAGGAAGARTVATMDEHLLTAGLSRYIRVFDPAAIAPPTSSDGEPIDLDATPLGGLECEVGGYLVRVDACPTPRRKLTSSTTCSRSQHSCFMTRRWTASIGGRNRDTSRRLTRERSC